MIRVSNIKVPLDCDLSDLRAICRDRLKLSPERIRSVKLSKKSVDARKKSDIHFIISLDIEAKGEDRLLKSLKNAGVIAFCFLYACSDELHQHFTPGRACMFTDVLIDTGGALTGMLMSLIILAFAGWILKKKAERSESRK